VPSGRAGDRLMRNDVEILIVDDREANLLVLESILSASNYTLVRATSGEQALMRVLERDFAVILIDVVMPGMDGFELATIIKQRARSRHTPIIFLTAGGSDITFIYRGYSVGAVDYLLKPLDPDVLRAKVAIFVELFCKSRHIQEQAEALRAAERRERELELATVRSSNQQRYRNLAEAIPQIVWTAAPDGSITYFNRRWYEYTGQTVEQAKGRGWMSALDPLETAERWHLEQAAQQAFELECRLRRHDGASGWHLCRAVPELDDDGKILGWLGTFTDCDDLKRACDVAEKAVYARDEFLSIASHELRTPLTTLQLRLESLKQQLSLAGTDGRMSRKLESSLRQSARLTSLVDGLLDVSRITNGKLTLQKERFDLAETAREIVEQFGEAAHHAGVTFEFRADGPAYGVWDRLRVEQIIQNLVSNAIKYAPNAPVEVGVGVSFATATIIVRDHGNGVAPSDIDRIFGAFERAVSTRNYGGLGLGLFIARENAVAHGGTTTVTSIPGQGAMFIVELPLEDVAEVEANSTAPTTC
jgi:PAS domain S-box-containing protein